MTVRLAKRRRVSRLRRGPTAVVAGGGHAGDMNTQKTTPHPSQLQESTAGEEDPGSGLDAADSAIRPDGVAPTAQPDRKPAPQRPAEPGKPATGAAAAGRCGH
ncbi:hypothetical protein GN316_01690 [Xylophilus sp. Kf1]|nr:hypothetical protein [Xylophilus sp. Kf1]